MDEPAPSPPPSRWARKQPAATNNILPPIEFGPRAEKVCRAIVRQMWPRFAGQSLIGFDDLMTIARLRAWENHLTFRRGMKGGCSYENWVGRYVRERVLDQLRRAAREAKAKEAIKNHPENTPVRTITHEGELFTPAEYLAAKVALPRFASGRGRRTFPLPAFAVWRLVQQRHGTSLRGTVALLRQHPEACEVMGVPRVPAYRTLADGFDRLARVMRRLHPVE